MTDTFTVLLRLAGHHVRTAFDGEEALRVASQDCIEIAVLDIEMPKLNGYEVARRLRVQMGPEIILIALTGWTREKERQAALDAGFDAFLMKPLDLSQFEKLLSEAFTRP